ncbi:immunoglobulin superfamily member 10-like [Archocentrus centrarchus]|uniref:immunoglobulin superfamily member 10-like n=1 Tax=Archocentrus centrarchus TaxID=63155 RepID=UPI0011EA4E3D|nr:immunoglobulin superfamily member 10-like [Archocentrus centrarchus]
MYRGVHVLAALLALMVLALVVPMGQSCPRTCNCYQASEVHCTFRSLPAIPPGLPAHTRRINLGFNSIKKLHDKSLAGLKKVELLMLHSNELHHLTDAVFRDMKSLQILKLSYNKLREIPSSLTFSGLTSLLRLYLDHNLLQHIHPRALLQLPSLRLLRLQGNRLHQLHPHTLCTLSLLNTYYFSTLRHLDLSNNSLTTLPKETLATAPLLETLVLQANPWSCDCRMNWFLTWTLAHPGLMKCPGSPQCPVCGSPNSLQGQGLLEQTALLCNSPAIPSPGREAPLETELSEIKSSETFREPLGSASLGLSDQQGYSVDLSCSITQSSDSQDIAPPPDLSLSSSSLPLSLSLSLECPVERQSYEKLWRILAYYSETAVRLEREIMLSKSPALAYRYRQAAETDGYYHTGVKASVKARPQWLLQPAISIQLNRSQSNGHKVQLIYSTRVSAHLDPTFHLSTSSAASHPWVLISTNRTTTALTAVAGSQVELSCPLLTSGNPKAQWILSDGSELLSPSSALDGRLRASGSVLLLQSLQLSDAGIYYCVARAGRDVDVLPLRLAVEESSVPPSGEQVGPPVMGTVGEPVTLPCRISGSPEPYISWILPDGTIVQRGPAVSGGLTIESNGSLYLPNPSLRDGGHYRCTAVNQYGRDALSVQLILNSQHIPKLRTSFPRGPQSAAGRSTRIRAPLLSEVDEGSGDGEEEGTLVGKTKHTVSLQGSLNRRYQIGKPRRRGPVREGPRRRGSGPFSSTDQKRNRFENRHRVSTNKKRIDPQKWADLLAKIRQKTMLANPSQLITTEKPTTAPVQEGKDTVTVGHERDNDAEGGRGQGAGVEAETEGSSVDDIVLQEEELQPIQPANTGSQIKTEIKTDTETDTETEKDTERSTEKQIESETETHRQAEIPGSQTQTAANPVTQKAQVTSYPVSGTNEIAPGPVEGHEREMNPNPSRTRPQNPRHQSFPNLVPNSRPKSPWNSKRKIGQWRIINRPRMRPFTPTQPPLKPTNPRTPTVTPDTTANQINVLLLVPTITSPAILLTQSDHINTAPNDVVLNPSNSFGISSSKSASPSQTPSPPYTKTYTPTATMTHSGKKPDTEKIRDSEEIPDTEESTLFSTPAPTHSNFVISETHTFTHSIQEHTETQTALGKYVDTPPSKHSEELGKNFVSVLYESSSPVTHFSHVSSVSSAATAKTVTTPTTAPKIFYSATNAGSSKSTSSTLTNEYKLPTTTAINPRIKSPTISARTISPTSSTTRQTATASASTTTTAATPVLTSTTPTTVSTAEVSTTTINPNNYVFITTTDPSTTISSSSVSSNVTPRIPDPPSTATASTTSETTTTATTTTTTTTTSTTTTSAGTISAKIPSTSRAATSNTHPRIAATMTSANTKTSSRERPNVNLADPRERVASGAPNQSRPPTDWKNVGANSIPDSHSSRTNWSPSFPVAPGAPVVRSRPRIPDPHIRTVSFPAESTARLACEAEGEPKPTITWIKVATGAVMSVQSRAQRFEVLSNGTLVIQNVQLQDRGTYICSAQSVLGRDRLLTTLEVWTRPPRMQLTSYREATIHQGGEVHLECQADGVPTPLLSWVLPDRSVMTPAGPSTSRISVDTNGTLHISGTLPSDRGVYRCVASNSAGAASTSVRVHVSSLPPVIQQTREEHLLLSPGMPLYAHCSARGAPPPTLRWRIPDGTLVRPSQFLHGNLFVLTNGTLHIRKVGPKDSGSYECTASNAIGTDKRTVRVKIEGEGERRQGEVRHQGVKAVATEKPSSSSSVIKDISLTIPNQPSNPFSSPASPVEKSKASHTPSSPHSSSNSYQFPNSSPKFNKTVTASHTHFTSVKKTNSSSLSPHSTGSIDNHKVSPSINNSRVTSAFPTDRRASAVLNPLPLSPFSKARIVSTSPSISAVHHGGILQLHCSVTGNPVPIIIWRTPSRKLVDMHFSFDRRLKVHPNGTLSVQAATEQDAGDYLCIARNKVADDYRLLRVTVSTKPARIEPKQPLIQTVSVGKPLKVDCQASGLPDPAVRWSLPDGTVVNSVLHGEDRGGREQQLTVFSNGTLLVPAVGAGEEGEYTCYAENQGGQDTMKVKVKVMITSTPTFADDRSYHVMKIRQGATARIPCQATGNPAPTVAWFSPANRLIPRSLGSGYYFERVVVVSDGTLEVRLAQKIDTGNYTCQASSSAGERSRVVRLEVETSTYGLNGQVGGRGWSIHSGTGTRSGDNINNGGIIQDGLSGITDKQHNNNNSNGGYGDNDNERIRNIVPSNGVNLAISGSNPVPKNDSKNGFNRLVSGITTKPSSSGISVGVNHPRNTSIKADNTGINTNRPDIIHNSNSVGNNRSTVREGSAERIPAQNNNEVIAGRASNDANTSRENGRLSGNSRNAGGFSGSGSNKAVGTSTLRGNDFSRSSNIGRTDDSRRNSGGLSSNTDPKNTTNAVLGVVTTVKQRAVKGQTVLLPCPSQNSHQSRLFWLLPGSGMLPAPYYGSRLTVYRNGTLELRGVRGSDGGVLVCVVRSVKGEMTVRVELEVLERQEEVRNPHRGERVGLTKGPLSKDLVESEQSLSSKPTSPVLYPRISVTQKPQQSRLRLPAPPHPVGPPSSTGKVSEPAVNTRTAPLVSIINGETLQLPCPQTPGDTRGSLSWTTPSGKVLFQGESGDSGRSLVQEDGTLTVQHASVFDRGTYTCRSTSYDSSSVLVITVPVIVIAYPPRITTGPSPVTYTRPGVAVELPCLTIATPRATVTWETPDLMQLRVMAQPRIYGNRYLSPQGSLVIQNPTSRDTGFYKCTAKNVIGVDTKATYLHVI